MDIEWQRILGVLAVCLGVSCSDADAAPGTGAGESVTDNVPTLPARTNRFYVANTEGSSISVVDHASRRVIEAIPLGNKPHGQAPSSQGDFVYVTTDGGHGEVIALDTATHAIAWRIDAGRELNEPHLTRDDRRLYAPDLLAARVAVVDVQGAALVDEIAMVDDDGNNLIGLHNTYASHDGRHMYVTAIFSKKIARIDVATDTISRVYSLSGEPRPAALTADDGTMYVQLSDLHGFVALDLSSGAETRRIEWPEPAEPLPGREQAETIPTKCHGIGITPDGTELWAATNLEGAVYVYSLPDLEQVARIEVGNYPNWIAFSSDGTTGYVTNTDPLAAHGTVSVISARTHAVEATLDVGKAPKRIHRVELPAGATD
jgi:YVTN family beta-propeller protein